MRTGRVARPDIQIGRIRAQWTKRVEHQGYPASTGKVGTSAYEDHTPMLDATLTRESTLAQLVGLQPHHEGAPASRMAIPGA